MITVDVYARVSLDRTGESLSVDNQVEACRKHAASQGWEIGSVYSDNSISATKGKHRPGFEALLARVSPVPVLVHNTDRLIRTMKELERVLETEITVYAVIAGTMDLSSSQGRMVARLLTSVAQNEGELKAERMMLSYAARAAKGEPMWRQPPLGHRADGTLIPEQAKHVSDAVSGLLDGSLSCREIARQWNEKDVPTTRHASKWTGASVRTALANPRIAGVLMFKGQRMTISQIQPIVTEETYNALYALLTAPERMSGTNRGLSNLLSGIALCGRCGDVTTVHATQAETEGGFGPVYRCPKGHNQHYRPDTDEEAVDAVLNHLVEYPISLDDGSNVEARTEALRIQGELSKWQAIATDMEPEEYLAITRPLRDQLRTAEQAMQSQSVREMFEGVPTAIGGEEALMSALRFRIRIQQWFKSMPLVRQRAILDHLFVVTLVPRNRWSESPHLNFVLK